MIFQMDLGNAFCEKIQSAFFRCRRELGTFLFGTLLSILQCVLFERSQEKMAVEYQNSSLFTLCGMLVKLKCNNAFKMFVYNFSKSNKFLDRGTDSNWSYNNLSWKVGKIRME